MNEIYQYCLHDAQHMIMRLVSPHLLLSYDAFQDVQLVIHALYCFLIESCS